MNFIRFIKECVHIVIHGTRKYYAWLAFLLILIIWGAVGYIAQLNNGLLVTNMRDNISWAFYIGNFTFLVGVA
ncbi:MAG: polysulfide reductase, partial [Candidatus Aminicenantes bacterium]|nr:polysulfide reductase [Candidatus Aminicenantes bacterium]